MGNSKPDSKGLDRQNEIQAAKEIPPYVLNYLRPLYLDEETLEDDNTKTATPELHRGFLVVSTAPCNVEDKNGGQFITKFQVSNNNDQPNLKQRNQARMAEISRILKNGGENPEVVIAVHGFGTDFKSALKWYNDIYDHANKSPELKSRNCVFIGYRWPSEKPFQWKEGAFNGAVEALPKLPALLFLFSLGIAIVFIITSLFGLLSGWTFLGWSALLMMGVLSALLLERVLTYFRDSFRASYFATPDLVSFIRELNLALNGESSGQEASETTQIKVKLSFIAHSMGCTITTNSLRILSDVFAKAGNEIGNSFLVGRMVLVAPDIPVESVIPRRSNVLSSALRRVDEMHVFTNEADLALRLASTTANYISFPARTRISGYRLGNLTVKHFADEKDKVGWNPEYGIVNPHDLPYQKLEIRSSNSVHRNLCESPFYPWLATDPDEVTNKITYYDCTDMIEQCSSTCLSYGVVSQALKKPALSIFAYARLLIAIMCNAIFNRSGTGINTHGGYFRGETSKEWIYILAFAGFKNLLHFTSRKHGDIEAVAKAKQIQILLSPSMRQEWSKFKSQTSSTPPVDPNPPLDPIPSTRSDQVYYKAKDGELYVVLGNVPVPIRKGSWGTVEANGRIHLVIDDVQMNYVATNDTLTEFMKLEDLQL